MNKHYLFPIEYSEQFSLMQGSNGRGINVEDFSIGVDMADVAMFPDYETFATAWLGSWQAFFEQYEGQSINQKQAFEFCSKLVSVFGIKT